MKIKFDKKTSRLASYALIAGAGIYGMYMLMHLPGISVLGKTIQIGPGVNIQATSSAFIATDFYDQSDPTGANYWLTAAGTSTLFNASSSGALTFTGNAATPYINVENGKDLTFNTSVGGNAGLGARVTLSNAGKLGIGITSPANLLDVGGNMGIGNYLLTNTSNTTGYLGLLQSNASTAQTLKVGALAITSSYANAAPTNGLYVQGNVGVGTTTPLSDLSVGGSGNAAYSIYATNSQTNGAAVYGDGSAGTYGTGLYGVGNSGGYGVFGTGGNVGVYGSGVTYDFYGAGAAGGISYFGNRVGVNTTSPSARLEVSGYVSYTVPIFAGALGNVAWTTSQASSARNTSILATNSIVGGNILATSDVRLKENIAPIDHDLVTKFFDNAKPVGFKWKEDGNIDTGFIAQQMLKDGFGYLVSAEPDPKMPALTQDGFTSPAGSHFILNYQSIVPIITAEVQNINSVVDTKDAFYKLSGPAIKILATGQALINSIKASVIETQKLIVSGIDVGAKLIELQNKVDSQQAQINDLQSQINAIKASR